MHPSPLPHQALHHHVRVTQDIRGVDGRLRVQDGATGWIVGNNAGSVLVLFDPTEHYVELTGCQQRLKSVDCIHTWPTNNYANLRTRMPAGG